MDMGGCVSVVNEIKGFTKWVIIIILIITLSHVNE